MNKVYDHPRKIIMEDDKVIFKCRDCDYECGEDGLCSYGAEACYYCPDRCETCGHGFCDQSC